MLQENIVILLVSIEYMVNSRALLADLIDDVNIYFLYSCIFMK
jgi:hypothetical protein